MGIFDKFGIGKVLSFSNTAEAEADDEDFVEDYDEEEDFNEFVEEEPEEPVRAPRMNTARVSDRGSNVVIHYPAEEMKVVIVRPRKVDEASNIAVHIKERRTVVLNLEHTDKAVSRRIIDFLLGAVYVIDGDLKKVSANTFLITPKTISVIGAENIDSDNSNMYCEGR